MYYPWPKYVALLLFLYLSGTVYGQVRIGGFNSVKGLGISTEIINKSNSAESDIITIYADSYGVFSGRSKSWGAMATYSHNYSFYHIDYDYMSIELHSGAGLFAGYVRDHEFGTFTLNSPKLKEKHGFALGISGILGARFFFDRPISLDVSFSVDPGMHIRSEEGSGNIMISLYNNGIYHFVYPQVRIYYNF